MTFRQHLRADDNINLAPVNPRQILLQGPFALRRIPIQANNSHVAAERMMPDLHISQVQLGWLETAFLISYTALQFPGAVAGQAIGSRRMITLCALLSVAAALAMPLAPLYSLAAPCSWPCCGSVRAWRKPGSVFRTVVGRVGALVPTARLVTGAGMERGGLGVGAAAAPAIIAPMMVVVGWRLALIIAALPVLLLVVFWWIEARDTPREHRAVTAAELAETAHETGSVDTRVRRCGMPFACWPTRACCC